MYLLGEPSTSLVPAERTAKGKKVPSLKDSLRYLQYLLKSDSEGPERRTKDECLSLVVAEARQVWTSIGFSDQTLIDSHKAKAKLDKFHLRYLTLCKSKLKTSEHQRRTETEFSKELDSIFDIAKQSTEDTLPTIVKQFLLDARKTPTTLFKSVLESTPTTSNNRERHPVQPLEDHLTPLPSTSSGGMTLRPRSLVFQTMCTDSSDSTCPSEKTSGSSSSAPPKKKQNVSPMVPTLDRVKTSHRGAAHILRTALATANTQENVPSTSLSTVYRIRVKTRSKIAKAIMTDFVPPEQLTVHFDSKKMKNLTNTHDIERFPVLVTGPASTDQLLGAPALKSGRGEDQATAVHKLLVQWGIASQVKCVSGDTTNSVSGWRKGAIHYLEAKLEKDLLYLACRRHVYETLLEGVAVLSTGPSQSPEVALFKKFKDFWPKLDMTSYQDGPSDENVWAAIEPTRQDIINFANNQLQEFQPRDDYRELLHLTLLFSGEIPEGGAKFTKPGALSKARWMMYLIYAFKTWMFRGQFPLTADQETGLRQLCIFGVNVYIKRWFSASTIAAISPREDLNLLKELRLLAKVRSLQAEAAAALHKLEGALWYLSDRLIPLALFDDQVPNDEKDLIAKAILEPQHQPSKKNHRWRRSPKDIEETTQLADLITTDSKSFFETLSLSSDFLHSPASEWKDTRTFTAAKDVVDSLKVTNEIAERGVALSKDYSPMCKIEENYQNLLLVVDLDRKLNKL
ncbi:uncharacterized protein LOC113203934 isoform X2 [Frankliniella occidentalis]|uniref:Uncharacterized protein LOC113203934 isoform X2 n=1 Tax=Frankliniella occidentalis TaxID=133901 RepID=A0A9C6XU91_FRAOC|nr:uncharacterized protein LOC113203934 isoform X2 [Frankliniella occidentalis]